MTLHQVKVPFRRYFVMLLDLVLITAAFTIAFMLRFDMTLPPEELPLYKLGLIVVLAVKPAVFILFGTYRTIWQYASLQDAISLMKIVAVSSSISTLTTLYLWGFKPYHRSLFILDAIILFMLVAASRLVWRLVREKYFLFGVVGGKRTIIVGAGDAGNMLLKEIRKYSDADFSIVGFVDDDPSKLGLKLSGVPVIGKTSQIPAIIRKKKVDNVIIAVPSARKKFIRQMIACCKASGVSFMTLPSIDQIINGKVSISQIKKVDIEDLLGRDPITLDDRAISDYLSGKRIMVTGAAGSIGSEICRQICGYNPAKLILLESAETPLYQIEKELIAEHPELRIVPVIGDVRNRNRIESIFDTFQPQVVFHAAAYKHVPMMEYNPAEAVTNNIGGTRILADAADSFGVENFVMISTDKAVNPTNVMGASKRGAELYVQAKSQKSRTRFTTVRFGNVLGSNGSVIPLFKEQILKGGPVTVTDPRVIRYFMTIPEACQLVLQAGCLGKGGEIFVLDMGEPVRILDLAEDLIRLSGLVPYEDIDIAFSGLRPGEKLFEELLIEGEGVKPTSHDKIRVLAALHQNSDKIGSDIDTLFKLVSEADTGAIIQAIKKLVPEFNPQYHFNGDPPIALQRLRPDLTADKSNLVKLDEVRSAS